MNLRPAPRPKAIMLRLMVLVTAAALAVFLQAGAGASSGNHESKPAEHPAPRTERPAACETPAEPTAALNHPALAQVAQPSAAPSNLPSSGCSRDASAGS